MPPLFARVGRIRRLLAHPGRCAARHCCARRASLPPSSRRSRRPARPLRCRLPVWVGARLVARCSLPARLASSLSPRCWSLSLAPPALALCRLCLSAAAPCLGPRGARRGSAVRRASARAGGLGGAALVSARARGLCPPSLGGGRLVGAPFGVGLRRFLVPPASRRASLPAVARGACRLVCCVPLLVLLAAPQKPAQHAPRGFLLGQQALRAQCIKSRDYGGCQSIAIRRAATNPLAGGWHRATAYLLGLTLNRARRCGNKIDLAAVGQNASRSTLWHLIIAHTTQQSQTVACDNTPKL